MELGSAHLLSAYLQWQEYNVAVGAANVQVIGANPDRVALLFAASFAGPVFVSTRGNMNAGQGFPLTSTQVVTILTFRDIGAMCQSAWYARSSAGVGSVWVTEVFERIGGLIPSQPLTPGVS